MIDILVYFAKSAAAITVLVGLTAFFLVVPIGVGLHLLGDLGGFLGLFFGLGLCCALGLTIERYLAERC